MFERFTDRARKVMALANQRAQHFHHDFITTGHLLMGIVLEGSGMAPNVMRNMGVNPESILREVAMRMVPGDPAEVPMGKCPHHEITKRVIQEAIAESKEEGLNYVGTEHLLLGILRVPECPDAELLKQHGMDLEKTRAEAIAMCNPPSVPESDTSIRLRIAITELTRIMTCPIDELKKQDGLSMPAADDSASSAHSALSS